MCVHQNGHSRLMENSEVTAGSFPKSHENHYLFGNLEEGIDGPYRIFEPRCPNEKKSSGPKKKAGGISLRRPGLGSSRSGSVGGLDPAANQGRTTGKAEKISPCCLGFHKCNSRPLANSMHQGRALREPEIRIAASGNLFMAAPQKLITIADLRPIRYYGCEKPISI